MVEKRETLLILGEFQFLYPFETHIYIRNKKVEVDPCVVFNPFVGENRNLRCPLTDRV